MTVAVVGDQVVDQIAALRLIAQMADQRFGGLAEALLVAERFLDLGGDAVAAGDQVVLQRIGVALELAAQVVDLTPQLGRASFVA